MLSHQEAHNTMRRLREIRNEKDDLKRQKETLDEEERTSELSLIDYFLANDLKNVRMDGVGLFYLASETHFNVKDQEAVRTWLEEKGDLDIMMSFNTNKFKSYCKELVKSEEPIPDAVEPYVKTTISLRKE